MKLTIKLITDKLLLLLAVVGFLGACTPDEEDYELGPKPEASFTITPVEGEVNTYLLTSETKAASYQWDTGFGFAMGEKVDTAYFPMAGEYTVKMNAFTQAGMVTAENTVTVAENDPAAGCFGDNLALLTGCSDSQTWVLAGAGSLAVGPADRSTVWWEVPEGEVEMRNCVLNDQFTFYADGTFAFDNLGDVWVEGNSLLGLESGDACADWSSIGPDYAAWGASSDHTYEVSSNEITVNGEGAYLGLYKVANVGEIQMPVEAGGSITYTILEITDKKLVVEIDFGGGIWTYTFKPEGLEEDPDDEEPVGNWYDGLVAGADVVTGGDMTSDEFWTVFNPGTGTQATTEFTESGLKFSNSTTEDTHVAVWQAVEVEAGQKYKFSAHVTGSGAANTWFEIYFGETEPVEGTDYTVGGYTGLNTWAGCGVEPFEDDLATIGCNDAPGTGTQGLATFDESGTIYLVIKAGSNGGGSFGTDGITISDVELVEMN